MLNKTVFLLLFSLLYSGYAFSAIDPGKTYVRIVAMHSGKCLTPKPGFAANGNEGAPIIQKTCPTSGGADFVWEFIPETQQYKNLQSGLCMDAAGYSLTEIIQWGCKSVDHAARENQRWFYSRLNNQIRNAQPALEDYCIDVAGDNYRDNAKTIMYSCKGGVDKRNQRFELQAANSDVYALNVRQDKISQPADDIYILRNRETKQCIATGKTPTAKKDSTRQSLAAVDCGGLAAPDKIRDDLFWYYANDGRELRNLYSRLCMDIPGSARWNTRSLYQWSCNGGNNQVFTRNFPGLIKPGHTTGGACLEVREKDSVTGISVVQQYSCNSNIDRQKWDWISATDLMASWSLDIEKIALVLSGREIDQEGEEAKYLISRQAQLRSQLIRVAFTRDFYRNSQVALALYPSDTSWLGINTEADLGNYGSSLADWTSKYGKVVDEPLIAFIDAIRNQAVSLSRSADDVTARSLVLEFYKHLDFTHVAGSGSLGTEGQRAAADAFYKAKGVYPYLLFQAYLVVHDSLSQHSKFRDFKALLADLKKGRKYLGDIEVSKLPYAHGLWYSNSRISTNWLKEIMIRTADPLTSRTSRPPSGFVNLDYWPSVNDYITGSVIESDIRDNWQAQFIGQSIYYRLTPSGNWPAHKAVIVTGLELLEQWFGRDVAIAYYKANSQNPDKMYAAAINIIETYSKIHVPSAEFGYSPWLRAAVLTKYYVGITEPNGYLFNVEKDACYASSTGYELIVNCLHQTKQTESETLASRVEIILANVLHHGKAPGNGIRLVEFLSGLLATYMEFSSYMGIAEDILSDIYYTAVSEAESLAERFVGAEVSEGAALSEEATLQSKTLSRN